MTPQLCVIIATKDRASFVQRALQSLVVQEDPPPFEVIVVDNASTDGTAEIVQAAMHQVPFPLTYLFEAPPNRGAARNRGVARTRAQTIVFVDDDVWLPPHFLRAHARAQERSDRVVSGPIIDVPSYEDRPRPRPRNYSNAFVCTCNVSLPKEAFDRVGGFDESFDLYGWEDTDLGLRLREAGMRRGFAWSAHLYHIKPPSSVALDVVLAKTMEKARMAARLVAKHPGRRARLATGAYPANFARVRVLAPTWILPFYAGILERGFVGGFARGFLRKQLLDGIYIRELTQALAAPSP